MLDAHESRQCPDVNLSLRSGTGFHIAAANPAVKGFPPWFEDATAKNPHNPIADDYAQTVKTLALPFINAMTRLSSFHCRATLRGK